MKTADVHARSLATSTALSAYYVKNFVPPLAILACLDAAQLCPVLFGDHAFGGWIGKPRASARVEVLLGFAHRRGAAESLCRTFGHLEAIEDVDRIEFLDRAARHVLIEAHQPVNTLFRATLNHTHTVHSGEQTYRIPSLEMALAWKFHGLTELPRSEPDWHQEAHDFLYMIATNSEIDLPVLAALGELCHPGGGEALVDQVMRARAGEKLPL
jgi:hypothetical protein